MTETISAPGIDPAPPADVTSVTYSRRGRWIEHWEPDDEVFWERAGGKIARKNLAWSMFAEHLGFSVWVLWTIVVLNLANAGINLSVSELFLLTLIPNLIGSLLRIPYTFAVPKFGAGVLVFAMTLPVRLSGAARVAFETQRRAEPRARRLNRPGSSPRLSRL